MLEALAYPFMQKALLSVVLVSIACGVVGALVVVNRMTFLAGGVAHAGYGGVGLAFFAGWPVMITATLFAVGAAVLAAMITLRDRERLDVAVGLLWAGGMAFGVLLIDLTPGYNVDLMSYLFGSILAVGNDVLWTMAVSVGALVAIVIVFYRPLLAISVDREFARVRGLPVAAVHILLVATVALAVMTAVPAIGLILVIALLTIPAYLAEMTARSLAMLMMTAVLWALVFSLAGLALAYAFDLTSGAVIVASAVVTLALAEGVRFGVRRLRKGTMDRVPASAGP
ncbi:metal ABC transporter permease [Rhodospira trueperi]|uniref:Zinc transport system permease protein n=1 Tax=Rhodospira trueperi TaxID=69960 RepID=A0A1G7EFE7_9PROT|nr:metal ABC transporter permease [Rhodospira trueperi]SDE62372.1 zinc transport system permease protein [Rhodospira trueperi]